MQGPPGRRGVDGPKGPPGGKVSEIHAHVPWNRVQLYTLYSRNVTTCVHQSTSYSHSSIL